MGRGAVAPDTHAQAPQTHTHSLEPRRRARREYFVLFFELVILLAAAATTALSPKRFEAARPVVAHFFTLATGLAMTAVNLDLAVYVW